MFNKMNCIRPLSCCSQNEEYYWHPGKLRPAFLKSFECGISPGVFWNLGSLKLFFSNVWGTLHWISTVSYPYINLCTKALRKKPIYELEVFEALASVTDSFNASISLSKSPLWELTTVTPIWPIRKYLSNKNIKTYILNKRNGIMNLWFQYVNLQQRQRFFWLDEGANHQQ